MKKSTACSLAVSLCLGSFGSPGQASLQSSPLPSIAAADPDRHAHTGLGVDDPFRPSAQESRPPIRLAHAILVKAVPDKETTVSDSPDEVLLVFNEGVGRDHLSLAVVDASGHRVDKHDARLDLTDRSRLRASIDKLNPGRYMVRYRVLSADGHVVSGKYFFQMHDATGEPDHVPNKQH